MQGTVELDVMCWLEDGGWEIQTQHIQQQEVKKMEWMGQQLAQQLDAHMLNVYTHLNSTYAHTSTGKTRGHSQLSSLHVHTHGAISQCTSVHLLFLAGVAEPPNQAWTWGPLRTTVPPAAQTSRGLALLHACMRAGVGVGWGLDSEWWGVAHYFLLYVLYFLQLVQGETKSIQYYVVANVNATLVDKWISA